MTTGDEVRPGAAALDTALLRGGCNGNQNGRGTYSCTRDARMCEGFQNRPVNAD